MKIRYSDLLGLALFLQLFLFTRVSIASDETDLIPDELLSGIVEEQAVIDSIDERLSLQWLTLADGWQTAHEMATPLPSSTQSNWMGRLALGYFVQHRFNEDWRGTLDITGYLRVEEGGAFKLDKSSRLDLMEAYLSQTLRDEIYIDIGRINRRHGSALGYNPTDYFKVHAVRDNSSLSARERRDNRLGTVMLRAEKLWNGGGISVAIAPNITSSGKGVMGNQESYGLALNQTNDRWRALLHWNQHWFDFLQPEVSLYRDRDVTHLGLSISQGVGNNWIYYGEWSGAEDQSLLQQALKQNRSIITSMSAVSDDEAFHQRIAVGFSYTNTYNVTTAMEYHYNGKGLSDEELQQWFDSGESTTHSQTHSQLWSIRGFAQQQEEPLGKRYLYIRTQANDIQPDLNLNGLLKLNLKDSSAMTQVGATYALNANSTLEWHYRRFTGQSRSEYGSLPVKWNAGLKLNLFF